MSTEEGSHPPSVIDTVQEDCDCDLLADDTSAESIVPCPRCSSDGSNVRNVVPTSMDSNECDDLNKKIKLMASQMKNKVMVLTEKNINVKKDVVEGKEVAVHGYQEEESECGYLKSTIEPSDAEGVDVGVGFPGQLDKKFSKGVGLNISIPVSDNMVSVTPAHDLQAVLDAKPLRTTTEAVTCRTVGVGSEKDRVMPEEDEALCTVRISRRSSSADVAMVGLGVLVAAYHFYVLALGTMHYQIKVVPFLLSLSCGILNVYGLATDKEDFMFIASLLHLPRVIEATLGLYISYIQTNNLEDMWNNAKMANVNPRLNWDLHPGHVICFNTISGLITYLNFHRICYVNGS